MKSIKGSKKAKKDQYQMPQAEKDFLLPPDANVGIAQLTRLFSRPNAVVRKSSASSREHASKTVGFYDVEVNPLGFDNDDYDFAEKDDGGFTFAYGGEDDEPRDDDADYNIEFDEVRKVEKIDIAYATVAKKVDVRRLKQDLWAELEDKTAWSAPSDELDAVEEEKGDDIYELELPKGEPRFVSFKETVEKMEMAQSQSDVTVSFYFICCLHLANEKGLKLDSTGLEDFMISLDDGSAPTFGTFGDGFTETTNKLSGSYSRKKRDIKAVSYDEEDEA
jgi:condensin complex subunit 2